MIGEMSSREKAGPDTYIALLKAMHALENISRALAKDAPITAKSMADEAKAQALVALEKADGKG